MMQPMTPRRIIGVCAILASALFVAMVVSLRLGAYPMSVTSVVTTLYHGAIGQMDRIPSDFRLVIFGIRLPRIAMGIVVGASLAVAGAGFQSLLRNPLADPYVLGVSTGAALGAIISLIVAPHVPLAMQIAAFAGATATIAAVYFLGRRGGQLDSATLLLAGIISASFLSAVIMFLMTTLSGRDLRGMAFWLMGDLATPPQISISFLFAVMIAAVGAIYTTASDLNFDFDGRAGSAASWRERGARENRRLPFGIAAYGPCGFGERRDRLCGLARAARDANDVRLGLSRADSGISIWRRDRDRARRHARTHSGCTNGVAGRCDDGDRRRARVHLSAAPESAMNAHSTPVENAPRGGNPAAASDVRLTVEQASYAYSVTDRGAPKFALGPVTFEARRREIVAILGPNASGKSTLLKLLAGLCKPLSGFVRVDDKEPSQLDPRERAQRIALVQQESALIFPLRVWEYVLQGRYPYGRRLRFESKEDCLMAENALSQVGASELRDRWMEQLSGGEKQRVILARALAQQPSLLLLDEPTQHLDIGGKVELLRRLRRLVDENRYTVVVVTHELNLAAEFSDRIVLLHHGKCEITGTPREVYRRDILEDVFNAPLDVEIRPGGKPRVMLRDANGRGERME
jgi:iron complex transport system ATP-binding protein